MFRFITIIKCRFRSTTIINWSLRLDSFGQVKTLSSLTSNALYIIYVTAVGYDDQEGESAITEATTRECCVICLIRDAF